MTQHSQEPWEAAGAWIYAADEEIGLFDDTGDTDRSFTQDKANANRAAACVNALAGIPNDMLTHIKAMAQGVMLEHSNQVTQTAEMPDNQTRCNGSVNYPV